MGRNGPFEDMLSAACIVSNTGGIRTALLAGRGQNRQQPVAGLSRQFVTVVNEAK
jgi:hypothetical protein